MAEKKTSTPKEIPLHEVVLGVMYSVNKEHPAKVTVNDVYRRVADNTLSENNISDVLNWLVVQKEVEYASGKYSLDRFSFLEERKKDLKKQGIISELPKDMPLHEVVLNAMFTANTSEPAKLTLEDIFWRVSDPKVHKSHLGNVMNWLQNQRRVEYLSGKYSLDSIEFQEQKKAEELPKKKTPAKKKTEETPKTVTSPVPEKEVEESEKPKEVKDSQKKKPVKQAANPKGKVEPEKKPLVKKPESKKVARKTEKPQKTPVPPKPTKPQKPIPEKGTVVQKVESANARWKKPIFIAALVCLIVVFGLLYTLDQSIPAGVNSSSNILTGLYVLNTALIALVALLFYRKEQ